MCIKFCFYFIVIPALSKAVHNPAKSTCCGKFPNKLRDTQFVPWAMVLPGQCRVWSDISDLKLRLECKSLMRSVHATKRRVRVISYNFAEKAKVEINGNHIMLNNLIIINKLKWNKQYLFTNAVFFIMVLRKCQIVMSKSRRLMSKQQLFKSFAVYAWWLRQCPVVALRHAWAGSCKYAAVHLAALWFDVQHIWRLQIDSCGQKQNNTFIKHFKTNK